MTFRSLFFLLACTAGGLQAQIASPNTNLTAREQAIIAASKADDQPRFNGARVIGVRPHTPLLYAFAVTGARPMTFSAERLPTGLKLDSVTGIVSGTLST